MGTDYPLLFAAENAPNLFVTELDGEIIAHVGTLLRTATSQGRGFLVASFGAVYTVPKHQGRGVATELLAATVKHVRSRGAALGLVSGARGLYTRAGFAPFPLCTRYRVAPHSAVEPELSTKPLSVGDLDAAMALYDVEPVRFDRPRPDWERVLAADTLFSDAGQVHGVYRGSRLVAYLAVSQRRFASADEGPAVRVLEVAGDRAAAAAALPVLAAQLGAGPLDAVAAPHDALLAPFAERNGWEAGPVRFPFSFAWWDPTLAERAVPWYGLNYV